VVFAGCSKKTTEPNTGGGGGGSLNLSLPRNGGTASFTFSTAGRHPYKCGLHPTIMFGDTVIVDSTSLVTDVNVSVVGVSTPGFNPPTVTVKRGGTVHWRNDTGTNHSVVDD
jgi:plastocyanin